MDDCDFLYIMQMRAIDQGGQKEDIEIPICKIEMNLAMTDEEYIFTCPYPQKYCEYKQSEEEGGIYKAFFTEDEITKNVKI